MPNILDFTLASNVEVALELGRRLKAHRLTQNLQQTELAARAGVARGTVQNLEAKGQCSLESLVRIVRALGLVDDLTTLFELKAAQSIAELARIEQGRRHRASTRSRA
jgi:transcriptional regulator with XRE-family HTH domain